MGLLLPCSAARGKEPPFRWSLALALALADARPPALALALALALAAEAGPRAAPKRAAEEGWRDEARREGDDRWAEREERGEHRCTHMDECDNGSMKGEEDDGHPE